MQSECEPSLASRCRRKEKSATGKYLCGVFVSLLLVNVSACHKPSPDWNGTWKLNADRSDIPGPTLTVFVDPSGDYHTVNGTSTGHFRCDGHEYPATTNISVFCIQRSPAEILITFLKNREKIGIAEWELSSGGKMLTIKSISDGANGVLAEKKTRYLRIFGSVGFAGGWRSREPFESVPTLMQLYLAGGELHYAFPQKAQYADPTLDGRSVPVHGAGVPSGMTVAFKPHGSRELLTVKGLKGQILSVGSLAISQDGRTLTEMYWRPQAPSQRALLIYEKQ